MNDDDARLVRNRLTEDKALFERYKAKLGQDRAELVSEIANVALLSMAFAPLRGVVNHLIPPAARVLHISERELEDQIRAYIEVRAITPEQAHQHTKPAH